MARSLAAVLITQGRRGEAAELVTDGYIESLAPSVADAEVERGNDLLEAKQFAAAAEAYDAALAAAPDHAGALVQLGVAFENLDRDEQALDSLSTGLRDRRREHQRRLLPGAAVSANAAI